MGVLRGGLLVYNTGRALESFTELMQGKAGCLAQPDVLISAVGTKVGASIHVTDHALRCVGQQQMGAEASL